MNMGTSRPTPLMLPDRLEVPSVIIDSNTSSNASDTKHRAVHQIRLSALTHNYNCVESAANRQKCSVIVVVKADGYGHGAIATAIHLSDSAGADSFAVATLEEAIALRKAFETTPPGGAKHLVNGRYVSSGTSKNSLSSFFQQPLQDGSDVSEARTPSQKHLLHPRPTKNVLRIFEYWSWGLLLDIQIVSMITIITISKLMVSGPEVAMALLAWVANPDERKRTLVERAATDSKTQALLNIPKENEGNEESGNGRIREKRSISSATLSNVSGQDLHNEVRAYLMNLDKQLKQSQPSSKAGSGGSTPATGHCSPIVSQHPLVKEKPTGGDFGGIEAAAKSSRTREKAVKANEICLEDLTDEASNLTISPNDHITGRAKRVLRWHAMIDSGMGRDGFKTDLTSDGDEKGRRDTVAILRELVDAEINSYGTAPAPLEFYGMCTHMAEANSESTYTNDQIERFKGLLKRVRDAGISVPTVSTDNSAALLTTTLTHFDPDEILSQPDSATRGYVRTGGAIYGQRPAFPQLRAVSTLKVAVRHVAILRKGESVGYDRTYLAPYDVRIATLTIGFADGYPRELGNGIGMVSIRGETFPLAGNVCMDMIMVDLGPAEDLGVGSEVAVGDVAVLWGPESDEEGEGLVRLREIASKLKTTQSAITCGLDRIRVTREYV